MPEPQQVFIHLNKIPVKGYPDIMKIHRFIIEGLVFDRTLQIRDLELVHQLSTVLKIKAGEQIALCDGRGKQADAVITEFAKGVVSVTLGEPYDVREEPANRVTLYAAIIKRDNFELIVQKAVEVGASKIVPIITRRTVKTGINMARLNIIIKEAAEQSGRGNLPQLSEPMEFGAALVAVGRDTGAFFCNNGGEDFRSVTADSGIPRTVFIGPEGGWDDDEIKAAEAGGLRAISFGSLTMRAETAAIVATHWAVTTK